MHSIKKIADYIKATNIVGNPDLIIKGLCGIDSGKDGYISYIHEEQYSQYFTTTKASAIIINDKTTRDSNRSSSQNIEKIDVNLNNKY